MKIKKNKGLLGVSFLAFIGIVITLAVFIKKIK